MIRSSGGMAISRRNPMNSEKSVFQCNFIHYEYNLELPGLNPGFLDEKPASRRLNYGMPDYF
jgi:hypothetical protein